MEDLFFNILGFTICAAIIIYSGTQLSYYGDKIAELTGLGRAWVGLILMSSVTSLPELITGISSVAIVNAPNLAAGDIFGSCVFNLLILSILDARGNIPLLSAVKSSHIVAAILGMILLSISGLAIFLSNEIPNILWVNAFTFILFATYILSIWGIFKYENEQGTMPILQTEHLEATRSKLWKKVIGAYSLHALIVVGSAMYLPYFGEKIANESGMGNSFFGTLFMAAATSLPELVVSMAAWKLGALDMAVGNLLGSNLFNMFILGIDDVFYKYGSLYKNISSSHVLSVFTTIIMTAVVGLGLLFKPKRKQVWILSVDTFIIVILYLTLMIYLYNNR